MLSPCSRPNTYTYIVLTLPRGCYVRFSDIWKNFAILYDPNSDFICTSFKTYRYCHDSPKINLYFLQLEVYIMPNKWHFYSKYNY